MGPSTQFSPHMVPPCKRLYTAPSTRPPPHGPIHTLSLYMSSSTHDPSTRVPPHRRPPYRSPPHGSLYAGPSTQVSSTHGPSTRHPPHGPLHTGPSTQVRLCELGQFPCSPGLFPHLSDGRPWAGSQDITELVLTLWDVTAVSLSFPTCEMGP